MEDKILTMEDLKKAFWATFDETGEIMFDEPDNTESWWSEFCEKLDEVAKDKQNA